MQRDTFGRVWSITRYSSGFGPELASAAAPAGDRLMATARVESVGAEPNVPVRGAAAILKMLDRARPPLQLVLGDAPEAGV